MDQKKFRKLLGSTANGYTESQLEQIQHDMEAMADILVDLYLTEQKHTERQRPA